MNDSGLDSDQELKTLSKDVIALLKKRDEKKRNKKAAHKEAKKAQQH